jgi:hypothetical protein
MLASCVSWMPPNQNGTALFQDGFIGAENDFAQAAVMMSSVSP